MKGYERWERGGMWAAKVHRVEQLLIKHHYSQCASVTWPRVIAVNLLSAHGAVDKVHACLVLGRAGWLLDMASGFSNVS